MASRCGPGNTHSRSPGQHGIPSTDTGSLLPKQSAVLSAVKDPGNAVDVVFVALHQLAAGVADFADAAEAVAVPHSKAGKNTIRPAVPAGAGTRRAFWRVKARGDRRYRKGWW